MSSNHPPRVLKLFCWILDVSYRSLFVSIEHGQTVAELKEEIVKQNRRTVSHVDAYQLDLWKVRRFYLLDKLMFTTFPQGIHRNQPEFHDRGSQMHDYRPITTVRGRPIVGRFPSKAR